MESTGVMQSRFDAVVDAEEIVSAVARDQADAWIS
jgi:hypothetical protein